MLRLLRAAFWAAALFAFVMAVLPHPPHVPGDPTDKVQHIVAFAVLAVLASLAHPQTRPVRIGLGLSAFGALIELVQLVPALNRDGDIVDWSADTVAAALVLALVAAWRRRSARQLHRRPDEQQR